MTNIYFDIDEERKRLKKMIDALSKSNAFELANKEYAVPSKDTKDELFNVTSDNTFRLAIGLMPICEGGKFVRCSISLEYSIRNISTTLKDVDLTSIVDLKYIFDKIKEAYKLSDKADAFTYDTVRTITLHANKSLAKLISADKYVNNLYKEFYEEVDRMIRFSEAFEIEEGSSEEDCQKVLTCMVKYLEEVAYRASQCVNQDELLKFEEMNTTNTKW